MIPCRYCSQEFVADTLGLHHASCGRIPVLCPNRCDLATRIVREDLDAHIRDHCNTLILNCTFRDAGCKFKVSLNLKTPKINFKITYQVFVSNQGVRCDLEQHLDDSNQQHLLMMCSMVTRQQQQISTLRSIVTHLTTSFNGILIWKINEFQSKMNEAKAKEGTELISPPFYTSQYGYKLQVSLLKKIQLLDLMKLQ